MPKLVGKCHQRHSRSHLTTKIEVARESSVVLIAVTDAPTTVGAPDKCQAKDTILKVPVGEDVG